MAEYITHGVDVIAPTVVLNISSARESGNIIHPIIGRAEPDVTLRPASLRTGVLELGFAGPDAEADSADAEQAHAGMGAFTLHNDVRPSLGFSYVVNGTVERALEDETRDAWIVRVGYQEVSA
jgi:hypothetical protein